MSESLQNAPWKQKLQVIAIALGVAAVSSLAGYGVGRMQGSAAVSVVEETLTEATQAHAAEKERLESALAVAVARASVLEAHRRIHLALDSLDERNFGIAQRDLEQAGQLLGEAADSIDGLPELVEELRGTQLLAAGDFGAQRDLVRGFSTRLNQLVPPEPVNP